VTKKVKLSILGISFSQVQAGAYALIFAEENGIRRLPIVIGTPEAQSIAIVMENIKPPRPLSHDLIYTIFQKLDIELKEVFIYKFEEGAFFPSYSCCKMP
jgi:bifunctional DNase/RNase